MRLRFHRVPNYYCFVGNGVVFEVSVERYEPIVVNITKVRGGSHRATYYPFRRADGRYYAVMDVSHFLQKEVAVPTAGQDYLTPLGYEDYAAIVEFADVTSFELDGKLWEVYGGDDARACSFNLYAFQGGIAGADYALLAEQGLDVFGLRLWKEGAGNFLFTTRTHGDVVCMKDTELCSYLFLYQGKPIVFRSGGYELVVPVVEGGVRGNACMLNLPLVYGYFVERYGYRPQCIDVVVDGVRAFSIVIEESERIDGEVMALRFRNSLGCMEVMEIMGKVEVDCEVDRGDTYERGSVGGVRGVHRSRMPVRERLKVCTGWKSGDELAWLLDLVTSPECYFVEADGSEWRCIVWAERMTRDYKVTEPTAATLLVERADASVWVSPRLGDLLMRGKRVWDDSFDSTFN